MESKGVGSFQWTDPQTGETRWIMSVDMAYLPKDTDLEKWLQDTKKKNIAIIDSFKNGLK